MSRFALILGLAMSVGSHAFANEAVDRFEAAWVTYNTKLFGTVLTDVPDLSWGDADRQAGTCILVAVADQAGAGGMTTFIETYERAAAGTYATQTDAVAAVAVDVPGLTGSGLELILQGCGMLELMSAKLQGG